MPFAITKTLLSSAISKARKIAPWPPAYNTHFLSARSKSYGCTSKSGFTLWLNIQRCRHTYILSVIIGQTRVIFQITPGSRLGLHPCPWQMVSSATVHEMWTPCDHSRLLSFLPHQPKQPRFWVAGRLPFSLCCCSEISGMFRYHPQPNSPNRGKAHRDNWQEDNWHQPGLWLWLLKPQCAIPAMEHSVTVWTLTAVPQPTTAYPRHPFAKKGDLVYACHLVKKTNSK